MRLGFVLISKPDRPHYFNASFLSLIKTDVANLVTPILQITYHEPFEAYANYVSELQKKFIVFTSSDDEIRLLDPNNYYDLNTRMYISANKLLTSTDVTHIGFLVDDFVYNSQWMHELVKLIDRHPNATAWSVYRSSYTQHHRIVGGDGIDVTMSMHDCIGVMSKEEWTSYSTQFNLMLDARGSTLDIHHASVRQGERWATNRDFMQNLGRHEGIETVDCAIDFVGED